MSTGTMSGADPDLLTALGQQMSQSAERLRAIQARLTAQVQDAPWLGRHADAFRADWVSRHAPATIAMAASLETAASVIARNAEEQRQASAATGGVAGATAVGGATASRVVQAFGSVAAPGSAVAATAAFGDGLADAGGAVAGGVASFGNALLNHPADVVATAGGLGLVALGATGELAGVALDSTGIGALGGVPLNIASAGLIATGVTAAGLGLGDLIVHASTDDAVTPASAPDEGFRGTEYSQDEYEQFVNGHTGDQNPAMNRPTPAQVHDALEKGTPERLKNKDGTDQNAESFDYDGTRVILNYDMPWKSTSYRIGQ